MKLLLKTAAEDLQDYLRVSMNVSVMLKKVVNIAEFAGRENAIIMATAKELENFAEKFSKAKSYCLKVSENNIVLCGSSERGMAQGSYYIEDLLNFKEAPIMAQGEIVRETLFSPRMTHSGWGMDKFPDIHLNAIAHAGMDAVLVFAKAADMTTTGHLDFNDLIDRAAKYGIDLYFYSQLKSLKHPSEKNAAEHYESSYGELFKACPRAKGVILR